ncbi:MAG: anaerobic selenocysteine-containing dehydrogenase [Pseudohongiellaceae bacterium]
MALCVAKVLFQRGGNDSSLGDWADGAQGFAALAASRSAEQWAELAGVSFAEALSLAEIYGQGQPAALLVGWGLGRRRNGAATVRVLDALGAAAGNIGVAGGGVSYCFGRRAAFDTDFVRGLAVAPRSLSEARLGPELLAANDPKIAGLWVTAGNPVTMLPDSHAVRRGIEATEFTVVVDTHPTDTTDVADLVLPTLTLLEDSDVLGAYGHHWLRSSRQAIAPPPGPRHELEILQGLAGRLGLADDLAGTVDDWKRRFTQTLAGKGATLEAMEAGPVKNPLAAAVLFEDRRFPTDSGKACLITTEPGPPATTSAEFPLLLMASSTPQGQSSQWSKEPPPGPPPVRVHPDIAAPFADVDVQLVSQLGAMPVRLVADDRVRRDMVVMAKGGMLRDGRCANALISAVESDAGGGAAYHDEPVAIRLC